MNIRNIRNRRIAVITLIFLCFFAFQCTKTSQIVGYSRPVSWGVPVQKEGLSNFYKVSDDLYRGAQPDKAGIKELKRMGIKTVINLRTTNDEAPMVEAEGIRYFNLPMSAFFPSKEKYKRYLEIVSDRSNLPAFVHCRHGADRTGVAVALYRIKIQQWNKEAAIKEMVDGGYHFHSIHYSLKNFVRNF